MPGPEAEDRNIKSVSQCSCEGLQLEAMQLRQQTDACSEEHAVMPVYSEPAI